MPLVVGRVVDRVPLWAWLGDKVGGYVKMFANDACNCSVMLLVHTMTNVLRHVAVMSESTYMLCFCIVICLQVVSDE